MSTGEAMLYVKCDICNG